MFLLTRILHLRCVPTRPRNRVNRCHFMLYSLPIQRATRASLAADVIVAASRLVVLSDRI